jgi:hypothetical protein
VVFLRIRIQRPNGLIRHRPCAGPRSHSIHRRHSAISSSSLDNQHIGVR